MLGTWSQSPPLDFPDSSDEEHNQILKINSDDSLDKYLAKSAFEQVDSVFPGPDSECFWWTNYNTTNSCIWPSVHEFVYKNPGTNVAVMIPGKYISKL